MYRNNKLIMLNKILCLLLLFRAGNCYDLPEVETPLGKIVGAWGTSLGGRKFASFEGIPYAKPPIGELRFEEPQPVEPWSEVLNATQGHTCPQSSFLAFGGTGGEEDCLHLNVYVPEGIDPQINYDVHVHIHGGAFALGSGHMMVDPKILLDKDYITVSINYRLGALGFLSTGDEVIPGNNGMKDQVLALKWVKNNIASFGGNPHSVTITGLSAGAASVHLHYFSPLSKGLFNRGLSQSGTAINPWIIQKNPLQTAQKLGEIVGCPHSSTSELKQCLKGKPVLEFVENSNQFSFDGKSPAVPFAPVIEEGSANPFLTRDPYLLLKEKKVLDVPWITSTTTDEGLLSSGTHYSDLDNVDKNWLDIAHYILNYDHTLPKSKRKEVAEKIKEFYLGPGEHFNKNNFKKFTQIFTDHFFVNGAEVAAKLQSKANKSPVYYYVFNYKEGENKMARLYVQNKEPEDEVAHGDDSLFFYTSLFFLNYSKQDLELRNTCQNILDSYVKTGKPSFDGTDIWQPTKGSELTYLNITGPQNIKLQRKKHLAPIEFWKSLGLLGTENLKDEL